MNLLSLLLLVLLIWCELESPIGSLFVFPSIPSSAERSVSRPQRRSELPVLADKGDTFPHLIRIRFMDISSELHDCWIRLSDEETQLCFSSWTLGDGNSLLGKCINLWFSHRLKFSDMALSCVCNNFSLSRLLAKLKHVYVRET